ncbi:hypothetical protein R8002_001356 [Citrobacter freundii]|nr:hypothetical protein [Citrobacter freundii]
MALESLPMARVRSAGGIGDLSTALVKMQDDAEMKVEKGSFSIAMTMADDMSALLSSFLQNNRAAKAKPSSPESIAEDCEASIKEKTPNCVVKINDFAKAGATTAKQLLNYLHQLFADPTEIALLLHAFILMKKKKKEDDELPDISSDILESALENLMKGPDRKIIKAGINGANTTKKFSLQLKQNEKSLRKAYEGFITQNLDPLEIYQMSIEKFGIENRYAVLDYYSQALHCDINSYDPSCSSLEFGTLLEANFRMNILRSADQMFMSKMNEGEYLPSTNEKDFRLLDFFFHIILQPDEAKNLTIELINNCMRYYAGSDKINFAQQIYSAIKPLPFAIFADDLADAEKIKMNVENTLAMIIDGFARFTHIGRTYG